MDIKRNWSTRVGQQIKKKESCAELRDFCLIFLCNSFRFLVEIEIESEKQK